MFVGAIPTQRKQQLSPNTKTRQLQISSTTKNSNRIESLLCFENHETFGEWNMCYMAKKNLQCLLQITLKD